MPAPATLNLVSPYTVATGSQRRTVGVSDGGFDRLLSWAAECRPINMKRRHGLGTSGVESVSSAWRVARCGLKPASEWCPKAPPAQDRLASCPFRASRWYQGRYSLAAVFSLCRSHTSRLILPFLHFYQSSQTFSIAVTCLRHAWGLRKCPRRRTETGTIA